MQFRTSLTLAALIASLTLPVAATAQGVAGSYLAARQASRTSDYSAAAEYYARSMLQDPGNPALMENAMMAYVGLGEVDRAVAVARRLLSLGGESQVANMVLIADQVRRENYQAASDDLQAGQSIGPLVDGLLDAWIQVGLGRMSEALEAFDKVAASPGIEVFGQYHKALALAMVGDFEGADVLLSGGDNDGMRLTRRGIEAYAQILSQLERNDDAIALIEETFERDRDPGLIALRDRLAASETLPFTSIKTAKDGVGEVFLVVAGALSGEAADGYTLLYSRIAEFLRPDMVDAMILSASLLERLERYELATETYNRVPRDDPAFDAAELGRAESLRKSGKTEAAIEVLEQLARARPDNPAVHVTLGDTLRELERYDDASRAYDAAVALYSDPQPNQWIVYFARGITHEREDRWEKAEADFRMALELNPDQPQVLNYLGYSYVEMGVKYDEALALIEKAVAEEPNSGYITDSLGWVLFRMGKYQDAVGHLERATELLPVDPIVNDHLGDAYWAVGRKIEAEFQWKRALSFDPEEDEATRIRRKLEVGLDVVLKEEGAEPTNVAKDG